MLRANNIFTPRYVAKNAPLSQCSGTTGLRDHGTTRPRDCETTGLRDYETTGQRDYGTTRLRDYETTRLRDHRTTEKQKNTGVLRHSQAFSVVRGLRYHHAPKRDEFLSEGVRCGAIPKDGWMGVYLGVHPHSGR